jgi:uncharacterized protein with HEPN domain
MRDISLYLQDILDAMFAIEKFVEGQGFDAFKEDDKTSRAAMRKLADRRFYLSVVLAKIHYVSERV